MWPVRRGHNREGPNGFQVAFPDMERSVLTRTWTFQFIASDKYTLRVRSRSILPASGFREVEPGSFNVWVVGLLLRVVLAHQYA
jgi:hypothetical protein